MANTVFFVTEKSMTRWNISAHFAESLTQFLEDCRAAGWPTFEVDGVIYVYATKRVAA